MGSLTSKSKNKLMNWNINEKKWIPYGFMSIIRCHNFDFCMQYISILSVNFIPVREMALKASAQWKKRQLSNVSFSWNKIVNNGSILEFKAASWILDGELIVYTYVIYKKEVIQKFDPVFIF